MGGVDFSQAPFILFWELTRACALACRHCRAEAQPRRHPEELTREEGYRLLDQIKVLSTPLLVFTGGDPMMRPDLPSLIDYATQQGLRVSLAPAATRLLTTQVLFQLKQAGLARLSISLDGPSSQVHDAFRATPGSFQRTVEALERVVDVGLSLQINTTVSRFNIAKLAELEAVVTSFKPALWDFFFLVPTGRGRVDEVISPQEHEQVFLWLLELSRRAPFDIKTTAGQHYRRVVLQRQPVAVAASGPGFNSDGIGRAQGVNDGNGCCFISHIGEVYPSGFLPIAVGNIRRAPLAQIYQDSVVFRELRDSEKLKGKCGYCEYNRICGGSRSRAYAVTGDYLEAEPYCVYQPAQRD